MSALGVIMGHLMNQWAIMFKIICQKSWEASKWNIHHGSIESFQPIHPVCNDFYNIDTKDVDTNYSISFLTDTKYDWKH